jgi:hypothetical protein
MLLQPEHRGISDDVNRLSEATLTCKGALRGTICRTIARRDRSQVSIAVWTRFLRS